MAKISLSFFFAIPFAFIGGGLGGPFIGGGGGPGGGGAGAPPPMSHDDVIIRGGRRAQEEETRQLFLSSSLPSLSLPLPFSLNQRGLTSRCVWCAFRRSGSSGTRTCGCGGCSSRSSSSRSHSSFLCRIRSSKLLLKLRRKKYK